MVTSRYITSMYGLDPEATKSSVLGTSSAPPDRRTRPPTQTADGNHTGVQAGKLVRASWTPAQGSEP